MSEVLAAHRWTTNADLILDLLELGYLSNKQRILDPTYGQGVWWKAWHPKGLVHSDLTTDGIDFRSLPHEDGSFDVVAFDPPYVSVGGRDTSTIKDFYKRYGLGPAPDTPKALQDMINAGITEAHRVVRTNGLILVKCADYISSGRLWNGTYEVQKHALEVLGMRQIDRFEYIGDPRPQPPRTRKCGACEGAGTTEAGACTECQASGRVVSKQQHARRNISTLFVFKKTRRRA